MKRILAVLSVALFAGSAHAQQQTSASYVLSPSAFTDLGWAPATVQVTAGTANVVIADTTPAFPTPGFQIGFAGASGAPIVMTAADPFSHVFASAVGATAVISATPSSNPLTR
jgi:hypothetical protein